MCARKRCLAVVALLHGLGCRFWEQEVTCAGEDRVLPGAIWLCPSMLVSGSLRKCQQPFSQSQAQLAPVPSVGSLCQIPHAWMGSAQLLGCRACFLVAGSCWEQEGRMGRGTWVLHLPPQLPFPSRFSAEKGKAPGGLGVL